MTENEHDRERTGSGLLDLVFGAAIIVLIFNISVVLTLFLLQTTAPSRIAVTELQFSDPAAVTEIQKTLTTTTPKENRQPLLPPPTIDRS